MTMVQDAIIVLANQFQYRDPGRFGTNVSYNESNVHPIGIAVLFLSSLGILAGGRKWVLVFAVGGMAFLTSGQRVAVLGVDFSFSRLILCLLFLRVWAGLGGVPRLWQPLDLLALFMASWPVLAAAVRGQGDVVVERIGNGADLLIAYFAGRRFVRNARELDDFAFGCGMVLILQAPLLLFERVVGFNLFSAFKGVSPWSVMRDSVVRVCGPFSHSILQGCWWGSFFPLFLIGWRSSRGSRRGLVFLVASVLSAVSVYIASSSTPLGAFLVAVFLLAIWPMRQAAKTWAALLFFGALFLHLLVPRGLHYLAFVRFRLLAGSTGYHRYRLLDATINRLAEWAMIGSKSTYSWGWGLDDVTCQYTAWAVSGGLLALAGGVVLLFGVGWKILGGICAVSNRESLWLWSWIAVIAFHGLAFLGVTYFSQTIILYWVMVGIGVSLATSLNVHGNPNLNGSHFDAASRFGGLAARLN